MNDDILTQFQVDYADGVKRPHQLTASKLGSSAFRLAIRSPISPLLAIGADLNLVEYAQQRDAKALLLARTVDRLDLTVLFVWGGVHRSDVFLVTDSDVAKLMRLLGYTNRPSPTGELSRYGWWEASDG